jgi:hypothetical protein
VHLLLPPSEGKTSGGRGRPLNRRAPGAGPLADARAKTLAALGTLVGGADSDAAAALLLPPGVVADALAANRAVLESPTAPALRRYAGVVYDGVDFDTLGSTEQRVAARATLIFSGLFGVVRGGDPVPEYRVPAKAVLPGLGVAAAFWRPVLAEALPPLLRRGLVVDLRSSDYAAMWRPDPTLADRVVGIRILSPVPRGGHAVISYNSKYAKGRLARALVRRQARGEDIRTVDDVVAAWSEWDGAAGAEPTPSGLDLVTR